METIQDYLKRKYGVTKPEAEVIIKNAKEEIKNGADPKKIVFGYFGLGPEYIDQLIS